MLVSIARLPRLALPVLLGVFFLSLSGDPSPAQAPGVLASHGGTPGQVRVMIARAATVIRTLHYQVELQLLCGGACAGEFPRPGKRRRLNITRISCILEGSSSFSQGAISLHNADHSQVLSQYLPVDYSSPNGLHTLNRAVDMQIRAAQHIRVFVSLASASIVGAKCTATGTLEVLQ